MRCHRLPAAVAPDEDIGPSLLSAQILTIADAFERAAAGHNRRVTQDMDFVIILSKFSKFHVEYLIRPPVTMNVNDAELRVQWLGFDRPLPLCSRTTEPVIWIALRTFLRSWRHSNGWIPQMGLTG